MGSRKARFAALVGLGLSFAAIGFVLVLGQLLEGGCLGPNPAGSCPALAIVNGEQYAISGSPVLESIGRNLSTYGSISKINDPASISGTDVFSVTGIDPRALLVAIAANQTDPTYRYVLLFGPGEGAYPAVCDYLPLEQRAADAEYCAAPA